MFTNTDGSDLLYVADPAAHPEITLNYLKRPEDLATLTAGTQDKHKSTRTLGPLAKDSHCIDIRVHQWWPHVQSLCHSVSDAHPKVRQSVMYKHTQRRLAGQQVAPSSVHRSVTIIFNHIPQARSTPSVNRLTIAGIKLSRQILRQRAFSDVMAAEKFPGADKVCLCIASFVVPLRVHTLLEA